RTAQAARPVTPLLCRSREGRPSDRRASAAVSLLAYLDPGSGSMILQAVVGGVAAVAVMGKIWWHRVLEILGFRKRDEESSRRRDERASRP
ncbi:MAG: hypothetical protein ACRDNR_15650, partial [Gaiellaceae bacterium]